ncbi:MAG: polysaccharide deacetylase family protein [Synechococcaceae cyanobacterium SM2_3_2]|nr:polysaccharide deacetylase family protein [Synechococcaceae cyanobacterium SM2_3_2]
MPEPSVPVVEQTRFQAKAQAAGLSAPPPVELAELPPFALHPSASLSYVPSIMYHDVVAGAKDVWFDTTVTELRQHFESIQAAGVTPISMEQLYQHLRNGAPLPDKAILLTFDDAYLGLYDNAFPLLKEFNYPAAYFVQTGFVGVPTSKDHFTWDQMREMDASGLVEFGGHTINHPSDLRQVDDAQLERELVESKRKLEEELGHGIPDFAYTTGHRDERVKAAVAAAGYRMSFTMDRGFTGQSANLLEVRRFDQFRIQEAILGAQTFADARATTYPLNPLHRLDYREESLSQVRTLTIRGGRPATVHAERRFDLGALLNRYQAPAGINGSFFAIPFINSASNVMIGPAMAANTRTFIPGRPEDNSAIVGRPLVLFGRDRISFLPFDPDTMNSLEDIQQIMPDVTDLFVGGLWVVKNGEPLSRTQLESFRLSSAWEFRPRAFFGVDQDGLAVIGATSTHVDAPILSQVLVEAGIQEAVLLDSGFSTSLIKDGEILATGHSAQGQPSRPVPHAILLYDLAELQERDPSQPEISKLELMASLLLPEVEVPARAALEQILAGQGILRQGDRGAAVMAIQMGLTRIAASQGRTDLLQSGPDGVYGNEVALAVVELGFGDEGATLATEIDDQTLQRILDGFQLAPPAALVDPQVPRIVQDPAHKPLSKSMTSRLATR